MLVLTNFNLCGLIYSEAIKFEKYNVIKQHRKYDVSKLIDSDMVTN